MLTPKKFFLGRSFRLHPRWQRHVYTDRHGIVRTSPYKRLGLCMGVVKGDDDQLPFIMPYPGYALGYVAMGETEGQRMFEEYILRLRDGSIYIGGGEQ